MQNHSSGTLAALLILGCLLNIASITLSTTISHAQLSELSDNQSGIFHLSHKNIGINAETYANDRYIDDDQANFFASTSRTAPYTPADNNYPFTLVDHYVLDSDLEINYDYKSIPIPAYPKAVYLSRHNISYADYTDLSSPPEVFFNVIKVNNPYTGEKVKAVYWQINDYETSVPEIYYKMPSGSIGYVYDTYIRVDSAKVWVWTRSNDWDSMRRCPIWVWAKDNDTDFMKQCAPVKRENSCLPPSAILEPKAIRIVRIPFDPSNPNKYQPLLTPPRSQCYYPLPVERNSAAAVNWSYNNNKGNLTPAVRQNNPPNSPPTATKIDSSCQNCR